MKSDNNFKPDAVELSTPIKHGRAIKVNWPLSRRNLPKSSFTEYEAHMMIFSPYHMEILSVLIRENLDEALIDIIDRFLSLDDEEGIAVNPTREMLIYNGVITIELLSLVRKNNLETISMEIFTLFLRYNFNKNTVCEYFSDMRADFKRFFKDGESTFLSYVSAALENNYLNYSYSKEDPSLKDTLRMN